MLAGMLAGAVLTVGGIGLLSAQSEAANPASAAVSAEQGRHGKRPPQQINTADMAKHIAEQFGVDESQVKSALEAKKDFRDIGQAAMLAKISGKSFTDVMDMKTDSNNWRDITQSLGISEEQVRDARNDMMAQRFEQQGLVKKDTALSLLKDGYQPRDIEMAGRLAKAADKDIKTVLSYKKINNRWEDVANQLGVDESSLRPHKGDKGPRDGDDGDHFDGHMPGPAPDFCE